MTAGAPGADPEAVGPYRIVRRLGAGGMGHVYLGRSAGGRQVAVKTVDTGARITDEVRRRFAREVALARRVGGAYTAAVLDADPDAHVPWLATEYIAAPSLAQLVRARGPLPPQAALWLAAGIAEALAALHAEGITHRDLKPSNVLLPEAGPRIVDFGISHAADLSRTTVSLGTLAFAAPEQARGEPSTPASDLYALGATLHHLTTGRPPYADTTDLLRLLPRVARGDLELTGLPPELDAVVRACLTLDPEQRPDPAGVLRLVRPLLAARPQAVGGADWLPVGWLEEIRGRGQGGAVRDADADGGTGADADAAADADDSRTAPVPKPAATLADPGAAAAAPARRSRRWRRAWVWALATPVVALGLVLGGVQLLGDDGGGDSGGGPRDPATARQKQPAGDKESASSPDPYATITSPADLRGAKFVDSLAKGDCLTVHYAVVGFKPDKGLPKKVGCDAPSAATVVTRKTTDPNEDCRHGADSTQWSPTIHYDTYTCLDRVFRTGDCFPVRKYVGGERDRGFSVSSSRRWVANLASKSDCSGGSPSRIFEQLARVTAVHPAAAGKKVCADAWTVRHGSRIICSQVIA